MMIKCSYVSISLAIVNVSLVLFFIGYSYASIGDRSYQYDKCLDECLYKNCSNLFDDNRFELRQPAHLKLLGWDCLSECKYECMWQTVSWFVATNQPVPQFNGKWPFIRILGIQEPASAFASILNLIANYVMLKKFMRLSLVRSRFRTLWLAFAAVSINTWIWSTIFHTRDTDLTEKMDYFSAFGLVLFQFNSFFVRLLKPPSKSSHFNRLASQLAMYAISSACFVYFCYHVYYLGFVHFDYGYNMQVNLQVGAVNSLCWLLWSAYNYFVLKRKHVRQCALTIVLVILTTALEVLEFTPILWTFDSHALWHISTIYIPVFWFNFLIEDSYYNESDKFTSE